MFYLFILRGSMIRGGAERERERDRDTENPKRLCPASAEPHTGLSPTNCETTTWEEIKSWTRNQLDHPGAPKWSLSETKQDQKQLLSVTVLYIWPSLAVSTGVLAGNRWLLIKVNGKEFNKGTVCRRVGKIKGTNTAASKASPQRCSHF